ncbi:MAG: IPT/TIG domain-containing protein [Acidobacteriota bacterium]|nr:IPT/TIG domain-containing protein [Acidobacteriota bacterium]
MAKVNITPQNIPLTEMQSATFGSQDDQGAPIPVTWTITPPSVGTIAPAGAPSTSITYTAPQQISSAQAITITATAAAGSASTTVFLTPISVQIIPASVQLRHTQVQQFKAIVSGDPANNVTWNLSPGLGTIKPDGLYTPDPSLIDPAVVKLTAISTLGNKTANATVTLIPPPLKGWKRNLLGFYLLGVSSLVFLLVALWPPSPPDPNLTKARQDAQTDVESAAKDLKNAQDSYEAGKTQPKDTVDKMKAELDKDQKQKAEADTKLANAKAAENASADLVAHPGKSRLENRPGVTLPRDVDLLFLVLIGGALGAFLHSARSFTSFVGNEELKISWAWWYYLHPFLGAVLALAFYMTVRGGFMAITTGAGVKTSELSPFALTSVAVLVGMFSKIATTKLGEVFGTMFQSSNPNNLNNPLGSTTQTAGGLAPGPKAISIAPTSGPAAGGIPVTITGTDFADGAKVNIGGVPATAVKWTSKTSITAMTPPHPLVGSADVEVVNPDGQKGVLPSGYQYV